MICSARRFSPATCPPSLALDLLADKWAVVVVCALEARPKRSGALRREIEGVSQKVLTQTLRRLERDGLVARTLFPGVPPPVEYALTPMGHSLVAALTALHRWADRHLPEVEAARAAHRRDTVGPSGHDGPSPPGPDSA